MKTLISIYSGQNDVNRADKTMQRDWNLNVNLASKMAAKLVVPVQYRVQRFSPMMSSLGYA